MTDEAKLDTGSGENGKTISNTALSPSKARFAIRAEAATMLCIFAKPISNRPFLLFDTQLNSTHFGRPNRNPILSRLVGLSIILSGAK